jgi:uncharacterized RDD family membrane protein YckC
MFSSSVLAVVAGLFALGYYPALTYFSLNFVSPYPSADLKKRAFAATIDALLLASCVLLYQYSDAPVFLVAGVGYLVERDAVRGQSLGKFCLGLSVISVETGRPVGAAGSALRNLLFLVPGANIAAVLLESFTTLKDPQGQRLGDRMAQTQVVEAPGAKDVVRLVQDWWTSFLGELRPFPSRPRHVPADR